MVVGLDRDLGDIKGIRVIFRCWFCFSMRGDSFKGLGIVGCVVFFWGI